jgi:hypothetical protein
MFATKFSPDGCALPYHYYMAKIMCHYNDKCFRSRYFSIHLNVILTRQENLIDVYI